MRALFLFAVFWFFVLPIHSSPVLEHLSLTNYSIGSYYQLQPSKSAYQIWGHYGKKWLYNMDFAGHLSASHTNSSEKSFSQLDGMLGIGWNGVRFYFGKTYNSNLSFQLLLQLYPDKSIMLQWKKNSETTRHSISMVAGDDLKIGSSISKVYHKNYSELEAELFLIYHYEHWNIGGGHSYQPKEEANSAIAYYSLDGATDSIWEGLQNIIFKPEKPKEEPTPKKKVAPKKKKKFWKNKVYPLSLQELLKEKIPLNLSMQISRASYKEETFKDLLPKLPNDISKKAKKLQIQKRKLDPQYIQFKKEENQAELTPKPDKEKVKATKIEPVPPLLLYTLGTNLYHFQSRYVKNSDENRTEVYSEIAHKNGSVFMESRNGTPLLSGMLNYDFLYASAGYRYKPIHSFTLFRDRNYYSIFQNPEQGIVQQPNTGSYWLGANLFHYGIGLFIGNSEKSPGVYFHSPDKVWNFAYSPETNTKVVAVNLMNYSFEAFQKKVLFHWLGEGINNGKSNYGFSNIKLVVPEKKLELEYSANTSFKESGYMTDNTITNSDTQQNHLAKFLYNNYDRIESFYGKTPTQNFTMVGSNHSVFSGGWGAICFSIRGYKYIELPIAWNYSKENQTVAGGLSYEYRLYSTKFILHIEERKNKDQSLELSLTKSFHRDWKLSIVSVLQNPNNRFPTVLEGWNEVLNQTVSFTDRPAVFKLRVMGSFLGVNVSTGRTKEVDGSWFYAGLQMKYRF